MAVPKGRERRSEVSEKAAPTTSQLKSAIDSGKTGDKVPYPDPAAAPLGTDAETGGTGPTAAERELAAEDRPEDGVARERQSWVVGGFVALVVAVLLGIAAVTVFTT